MLFWCKNRCSCANCRACARVKCLDGGRQNSWGQGKVVEKGLESHFRGEVGCCPVGWWPGNSWRNPLACYVLVQIIYYSMVENAHIICSLFFFANYVQGTRLGSSDPKGCFSKSFHPSPSILLLLCANNSLQLDLQTHFFVERCRGVGGFTILCFH